MGEAEYAKEADVETMAIMGAGIMVIMEIMEVGIMVIMEDSTIMVTMEDLTMVIMEVGIMVIMEASTMVIMEDSIMDSLGMNHQDKSVRIQIAEEKLIMLFILVS